MPYSAMQRHHGQDLSQLSPQLVFKDMARVPADVAGAVHQAHRAGLIHRDLKPSIILVVTWEDGDLHPFVLDFGLALDPAAPDFTLFWATMGRPAFMSPGGRAARGDPAVSNRRACRQGLALKCDEPRFDSLLRQLRPTAYDPAAPTTTHGLRL